MNNQTEVSTAQIQSRIEEVKIEFAEKYGTEIEIVLYKKDHIKESPSLEELETCANIVLKEMVGQVEYPIDGIKSKKRTLDIVTCRHVFNFLSCKTGYTLSNVGRFMGLDHATILASRFRVKQLLDSKDLFMTNIYRRIAAEVSQYMAHKLKKEGYAS